MVGIAAGKRRRQDDSRGRELITISMWIFIYHNICMSQELQRNRTENECILQREFIMWSYMRQAL